MPVVSAGLLLWRRAGEGGVEVFLAHLGGPFWARKHEGAWSIPKGEYDPAEEEAWDAACREFFEEIGVPAPGDDPEASELSESSAPLDLGEFRYSSGKRVRVFAVEAPGFEVDAVASNLFELEWPPRSGRRQWFPEIDDARWMPLVDAVPSVSVGQRPALEALAEWTRRM
ncbi:NUDIX domain-containing protein [Agromyces protaetiae]|uniref:NUDIX domain-containing protein n=1 Tax=Agromyces protaetiae TaxID=2509455 RepID=A0A4P6FE67_9MICO|nr:NUDIX domain-containing protein [Agromyces protaetiae]QAY71967.1 NUDIX domain-containing protein [Agromyces protaetiae]